MADDGRDRDIEPVAGERGARSVTAADDVTARYHRPARRGVRTAWVVVGVVAAGALLVMLTLAVTANRVSWREVGFDVHSPERTTATFEVFAPAGSTVRCQVRATNDSFVDVGQVDVDLGPVPRQGLRETVEIRTLAEAASASVRRCVVAEADGASRVS